jgi:hypothetical protein
VEFLRLPHIRCGCEFNGTLFGLSFMCQDSEASAYARTMDLGPFVGPIYTIILIVDCLFFALLELWMPRENIDYVDVKWDATRFETVGYPMLLCLMGKVDT